MPSAAAELDKRVWFIHRDQGYAVLQRLCDEDSVERIAVEGRQYGKMDHGEFIERQIRNLVSGALSWQIFSGSLWQGEFAEGVLDNRLLNGSNTQVNLVGRIPNRIPKAIGQSRIGADVPEEDLRVEQQSHDPSNSLRISSGSGWLKSSGTENRPAHKPKGRGKTEASPKGRTSATGLSPRTTRIVSPVSTRPTNPWGSR